jgi:hypothetical protein
MTDFMPEPEFVEVSDRIWGAIADYLPHKDGKVHVGFTKLGLNPKSRFTML